MRSNRSDNREVSRLSAWKRQRRTKDEGRKLSLPALWRCYSTWRSFLIVVCLVLPLVITGVFILPVSLYASTRQETIPAQDTLFATDSLKTIIIDNYYPYTFVNDKEEPDGFSVDLMHAVGRVMGFEVQIQVDTWDHALQSLQNGDIDFLPMMAFSSARDKLYDFSAPHTIAYDSFFTRKDIRSIRSMDDLRGKTIIVMEGDQAHDYLRSISFVTAEQLILVDSLPRALQLLASGTGDTALMPKLVGLLLIRNLHLTNLEMSPVVVDAYNRPFSFAVKEGNQAQLERLSQGLSIVEATGEYRAIYSRWFGASEPQRFSFATLLRYLGGIALVFGLLGAFLLAWTLSLRRQVARRTRSLQEEIRERNRVEETLRASQAMLASILNSVPQSIFWKDRDGVYLGCNENFAKAAGVATAEQIVGKTDYDLHWPRAEADAYRSDDHEVIQHNQAKRHIIEPLQPRDGGRLWIDTTKVPLTDVNGEPYGVMGVYEDVTERRHAEEHLRQSEAALRKAQQVAHIGSWTWFVQIDHLEWSDEMYHIFGIDKAHFTGALTDVVTQAIHPDDRAKVEQANLSVMRDRKPQPLEYRVIWPDQSEHVVWGEAGELVLDEVGNSVALTGIVQDITAHKQAEEEIRKLNAELEQRVAERTTQLEATNREMEAFAYSVSHDLRAPLRSIDGWSLALLEDYGSQLDATAHQFLDRVRSETQRMGQLIDDLLRLSHMSRIEMQHGPVNLSALAQTIAGRLQEAQPERRFEFIIQPELTVRGDSHLLEIVLTNLLSNAVKFTAPRPLARIEFGQTQVDGRPVYFVRDNGVGFDLAYARNLFGAFQRMHRQSEFPGTGIGLVTVQRIVHRHGGTIWADAQVDQGATFYFILERPA